jgi:hypothetical protein
LSTLRFLLALFAATSGALPQQPSTPASSAASDRSDQRAHGPRLRGRPVVMWGVACLCESIADFGITKDVLARDIELVLRRNHVPLSEDLMSSQQQVTILQKRLLDKLSAQLASGGQTREQKDDVDKLTVELDQAEKAAKTEGLGLLQIVVHALKNKASTVYSIAVGASFEETATVSRTGDSIEADVWTVYPLAMLYSPSEVPSVREEVRDTVERFALEYLKANPQ